MNHLLIDAGNTRIKAYWYAGDREIAALNAGTVPELLVALESFADKAPTTRVLIAQTGAQDFSRFEQRGFSCQYVDAKLPLPVQLDYGSPESLGADRIALVCGAQQYYPKRNVLVIDLGTCITYDLKDDREHYLGGSISPGVRMRFKAMHEFTARLPLPAEVAWREEYPWPGKNTTDSLYAGVWQGLEAEINGVVSRYKERFPGLIVLVTGGDAEPFAQLLKNDIFAAPKILVAGLQNILKFNALNP